MGRRRFFHDDDSAEEPLVNLTPLIDVVFVVLISFILIAPVLEIDQVDLAVSGMEKKKEALPQESSPLTVIVRKDDTIWIQGKSVSLKELETLLLQQKKAYPGKVPQVIHDRNATFGAYQSVKNVFERCGFDQMDVILKPG